MNNTRRLCLIRIIVWLAVAALLVLGLLFFGVGPSVSSPAQSPGREQADAGEMLKIDNVYPIMGTFARITFWGRDRAALEKAADTVSEVFNRIQKLGNLYDAESELSRLNAEAARGPFVCSAAMYELLREARKAYEFSGGLFDVSAKPLMDLWGFYRKRGEGTPSQEEIDRALKAVGFDKVVLNDAEHTVSFTREGMALDFGGIAKGYAVDTAFAALDRGALRGGIINLGGNMRFFGDAGDGRKSYSIGVQHPRKRRQVIATLELNDCGVATSGDYERFVVIDGKRYAHIMNPKTGFPIENMLSVTAVTPSGLLSDVASTSVFLGGEKLAEKFKEIYPGCFFLIYRNADGKLLRESVGTPPDGGVSYLDE